MTNGGFLWDLKNSIIGVNAFYLFLNLRYVESKRKNKLRDIKLVTM